MSDFTIVEVQVPGPITTIEVMTGVPGPTGSAGAAADLTNYYTKTETDGLLATKAAATHTHVTSDITNFDNAIVSGGTF